jgi:transcriptional regulator with XRE-family HTH domain
MRTQAKAKAPAKKAKAKPVKKAKPAKTKKVKKAKKAKPAAKPAKQKKVKIIKTVIVPESKPAKKVKPAKPNNNKKKNPESIKIGNEIKAMRMKAGLTQLKLAKALKVSPGRIAQFECGVDRPNEDRMKEISKILNVKHEAKPAAKPTPKPAKAKPAKAKKIAKAPKPAKAKKAPKPAKKKVELVPKPEPKQAKPAQLINVGIIAKEAGTSVASLLKTLKGAGIKPHQGQISIKDLNKEVIEKLKHTSDKLEEIKSNEVFVKDLEKKLKLTPKRINAAIKKLKIITTRRFPKGELKFGSHFKNAISQADAKKLEDHFSQHIVVSELLSKYLNL